MLSQRQADFRREYRSRIAGWYNGYFHVLVIYLMGGGALALGLPFSISKYLHSCRIYCYM